LAGAEECFLRLLKGREGAHFASVPIGLHGYVTRHNLAVVYQRQGRLAEAEAQWRAALAERPDSLPSWFGLAELYLGQGRWSELEEVAARLDGDGREPVEGRVLRARGYLARSEFAEARRLLEDVVAKHPNVLRAHLVLSHVLLQEGRDWNAAEKALRDALALDPGHQEAQRNLAILLREHACPS
jgi:Tfp pilus assembly protein PilF